MTRPIITLLTDFGLSDYYVSAMKGAILSICPDAQLVDVAHDVAPFRISHAAWLLDQAWRTFPAGTIHIAVVDPGVGSERRALLAQANGHSWVAPDNGILTRILAGAEASEVREITAEAYFRRPVSSTFHGRDIFAPVAAHLASGVPAASFGPLVNNPRRLPSSSPIQVKPGEWVGEVLWIDRFGNIVTSFCFAEFAWIKSGAFQIEINGNYVARYGEYYNSMEPDCPYVSGGSSGQLEIVLHQQNAAKSLGVEPGATVSLRNGD